MTDLNSWNLIYSKIDPVAFKLFGLSVHWYGIMYVLALVVALLMAKYFAKKDSLGISNSLLDNYFFWVEIGVILGARLGYILIYDSNTSYYLLHPWQIFNPFANGEFVGIRGMSYHGAVVGFILATLMFCKRYKQNLWILLDLVALSVPLGYFFGRIGNFLNQELFGRVTNEPWAIMVAGSLRHPSQLYEAVLEGLVLFVILFIYRKYKKFDGELIAMYAMLYTLARFLCEFFREPDFGIGFVAFGMSMGQILSICMFAFGFIVYINLKKKRLKK
ncbi:prolipoprotein diacylglyceryl transferase [Campylobacter hyointestinalis]|uniref:Phosphatidylglycerol--prolipoprotein diacylglyceryl transferase n=1 Tax=Campylobacter hyointestinalis subsp. hyointestinalis TaxID=91352 RepID=A0A855N6M7_CAMHY|nr:prolipoprotein diacylglyceryl transferase [Campylobacter hyointestinalis]PPB58555.1 prolipoprotein diacylglyceryl transferase [Campylobacter hyointestinalis subsp. hyointestinalis]PPB62826.1 prolipoprotein diacylglyceryl transferase [Campylobacter hyointestinalis subsp. hyointestinalis]PPB71408.1 prolipoprotein diacylglyceryl transferase [Campylobacter hyointestinalis subsp. hyointestinalis]